MCYDQGLFLALKGHVGYTSSLIYKEGYSSKFTVKCMSADKIMLFTSSGKFFTLEASKLPGGRGAGEPVRLLADVDAADAVVALFAYKPDSKLLVASTDGDGFVVEAGECLANTRKGKQVLNVKTPAEAICCVEVAAGADHVATIGDNRKLLVFKLAELPEMARGKGVRLQKFKDGGLSDVSTFKLASGLSWLDSSGRTFSVTDLAEWIGERAQAGRLPPRGFPKSNKF